MRYLLLALALVACGKPAALHVSAGSAEPACTLPGLDVLCTLGGYTQQSAPKKYGSFLGPGFMQRPDILATLGNSAVAGDTVQWDGSKWVRITQGPAFQSGLYYLEPNPASRVARGLTNGNLYFVPFQIWQTTTWQKIGVDINATDATGAVRVGVYSDNNGVPGARLVDAGTVSTSASGSVFVTTTITLTPGRYWSAIVLQGATGTPSTYEATGITFPIGNTFAPTISATYNSYVETGVNGALPANASSFAANGEVPLLVVQVQ